MRRAFFPFGIVAACFLALPAGAQQKPKDPVLFSAMQEQFAKLTLQLTQITEKLAVLEAELARIKQQQAELNNEVRNTQNDVKNTDATLNIFKAGNQQDFISLRTDVTQLRTELVSLTNELRKAPAAPAGVTAQLPEGYINEVGEREVKINLGSKDGIREGMRFGVYRASDPRTQIGVIEVKQILDASNSRAVIIYHQKDLRFEFSDIVRLLTGQPQ